MKRLYDIGMIAVPMFFAGSHFGRVEGSPFLSFKIHPLGVFLLPLIYIVYLALKASSGTDQSFTDMTTGARPTGKISAKAKVAGLF